MLGPLPEGLRVGVLEAYGPAGYGGFMRRVVALQEGTMPLEVADAEVFGILGYDGGRMGRDPGYRPFRDASSQSHRPDLYRTFVQWSTAAPPVAVEKTKGAPFAFGAIGLLPAAAPPFAPAAIGRLPAPAARSEREVLPGVCHELAFHQQVLEQLADKVHNMETRFSCTRVDDTMRNGEHLRVDTKMPSLTGTPAPVLPRAVGGKSAPLSSDARKALGPLPEELRRGVYEAYGQGGDGYRKFMQRVLALQEGTMALEAVDNDVFDILGYDQGPKHSEPRSAATKSLRPDLYRLFVQWSTAAPPVAAKKTKNAPFASSARDTVRVFAPLPEGLRAGVREACGQSSYRHFMRLVAALQEGTTSLEDAYADVFDILRPHRPDLYSVFVAWSAVAPGTPCLASLTTAELARDLVSLDAALAMSPTMLAALRVGAAGPSVPASCGALRLLWQAEFARRVSADTPVRASA